MTTGHYKRPTFTFKALPPLYALDQNFYGITISGQSKMTSNHDVQQSDPIVAAHPWLLLNRPSIAVISLPFTHSSLSSEITYR